MNRGCDGSQLRVMPKHRPQDEKVSSAHLIQLLPLLAVVPVTARHDKVQQKEVWTRLLLATDTKWRQQGREEN